MASSERKRSVTELELIELSEKVDVNEWRKLGLWLDFREAALSKYERENWFSGAASMGTYKMLCDWKQNSTDGDQRRAITIALERCELGHLAKEVFKESLQGLCEPEVAHIRSRLISYAKTKLLRVPLIPWAKTSYIQVDAIFISVQLILHVNGPDIPIRCPLNSFNDILTENISDDTTEMSRTRFIVRGKAGSGKTTLLIKLLSDWCKQIPGALLSKYKLVYFLPMRKLTFDSNLGDAVVKYCLPRDARISAASIERICHENPSDVFILLDGYDEFSGKGQERGDPGNIVAMLRNEEFIDVQVMVTTRPGRLDDFQEFGDFKHLEVTGFTAQHVSEYIENTFTGTRQQIGKNLYAYFDGNNLLAEVSSVPLLLCAFCQVAKWTNGIDFGKLSTYTSLFERLIRCFFAHELAKPKVIKSPDSSPVDTQKGHMEIMSEEFLFDQLGKVALLGFFRENDGELLFSENDFEKCCRSSPNVIEQGCIAGLLTKDDNISIAPWDDECESRQISFVLKTVQEMFGGRYLARLREKGEMDIFKYYLKMVNSAQRVFDLANVLMFGCGKSEDVAEEIIAHVIRIFVEDESESIERFWNGQLPIKECRRVQQLIELILNLNYEAQAEGRFNKYLQPLLRIVRLFSPAQRTAKTLGYMLQHCEPISVNVTDNNDRQQTRGLTEINDSIESESFQYKHDQLPSDDVDGCSTFIDHFYEIPSTNECRLKVDTLEIIHVNKMFDDQFRQLRDFLPSVKKDFFQSVNNLALVETKNWTSIRQRLTSKNPDEFEDIDHLSNKQFVAYLPVKEELKKWQVSEVYIDPVLNALTCCSVGTLVITGISRKCKAWKSLFQAIESPRWSKLVKLDVSRNNLSASDMSFLARALFGKPNLQHLDVSGNVIKKSFISILPDLPNLRRLYLNSEQMEPETLAEFGGRLQAFPKIAVIDLNDNPLDDSAAAEIGDGLVCCNYLKRLRLDLSWVSDGGIKRLAVKIKGLTSLTHLGLYKHQNADELVRSVTATLNHLPELTSLSLTGKLSDNLSDEALSVRLCTTQSFTKVVTTLLDIQIIELYNLRFCAKGFLALLDALREVQSLREFRVAADCLPDGEDVEKACRDAQQSHLRVY